MNLMSSSVKASKTLDNKISRKIAKATSTATLFYQYRALRFPRFRA
jgi:hypothetical protein